MVKSLIDKLKKGFKKTKRGLKKAVLTGITASMIGFAGCCIISPGSPEAISPGSPEAILDVNPVYGQAPLEVSISLNGIDDKKEITDYKIEIDKGCDGSIEEKIIQEKPIYIKRSFDEDAFIYGEVKNSCDETDRKKETVDISHPGNNPPQITSNPITEINEQQLYNYDVEAEDADGDKLTYSLLQAPSWLSIDSSSGLISGNAPFTSSDTSYNITVKVSDGKDSTQQAYTLNVYNLLDISGRLEDCENDGIGVQGVIRVYDANNPTQPLQTDKSDSLGNNLTYDGNFVFQLNKRVSQAILQARIGISSPESYVRSVKLDGSRDYINVSPVSPIRVVMYPDFDTDGDGFVNQTDYENYRIYFTNTNIYAGVNGLKKWDLEGRIIPERAFKGIGIFSTNPVNNVSFTKNPEDQVQTIKNKIIDANDIEVCIRGSNLSDLDNFIINGEPQEGVHYTISGGQIILEPGYILVVPDDLSGTYGDTEVYYYGGSVTGIIDAALIRIKNNIYDVPLQRAVSHEFKHAFNNPNDINLDGNYTDGPDLLPDLTILRYDTPNTTLGQGEADKKDPYIINEETFNPAEKRSYLMNLGFLDEGSGDGYDLE